MNKNKLYILCVLIFISGLILFYVTVKQNISNLKETLIELSFPGTQIITLNKDDNYSIYHQFEGTVKGEKYLNESLDINLISVELINTADRRTIELVKPESIKRYRYRGRKGIKLFEFNNEGLNEYQIKSSLSDSAENIKYILVFENGFENKRVSGILASQAALIIPTIFALVLFIRTYIRK